MESYAAFEQAITSTARVVKNVRADQMTAPTPCTEWDVRTLLNHVIGTLWLSEALLTDSAPRHPMAPGGLPASDLADRDPATAYAEAAAAALAAAGAGDAITRMIAAADDAIKVEEWDSLGNLLGCPDFGHHTMTILQCDILLEILHLGRGRKQEEVAAEFDVDGLSRFLLEVLQHSQTLDGQLDVDAGRELVTDASCTTSG
jgi:hypothetical protein